MKLSQDRTYIASKMMYVKPMLEVTKFSCEDIMTTSGNGDDNQGEWDPQNLDITD